MKINVIDELDKLINYLVEDAKEKDLISKEELIWFLKEYHNTPEGDLMLAPTRPYPWQSVHLWKNEIAVKMVHKLLDELNIPKRNRR